MQIEILPLVMGIGIKFLCRELGILVVAHNAGWCLKIPRFLRDRALFEIRSETAPICVS